MRKAIGVSCMCVGAALLIAALFLLFSNRLENENAGNAANEILPALITAIKESASVDAPPDNSTTSDNDTPTLEADEDITEMTVVTIDGEKYIGYIAIPVLGIELPVMNDWDYEKLKSAPCRYFGSAKADNLVVCGHNYARHFGTLKNLQEGDQVFFVGTDGVTIAYCVDKIEILQPTEICEMLESGYDLTLYTCTYSGQSRVTVRCNRAVIPN